MQKSKTKTRPGLVALYDIRPGNGAGPFLQPQSLHGAISEVGKSFQSVNCTGTDNITRTTKKQNTEITQNNTTQVALVNSITQNTFKRNLG